MKKLADMLASIGQPLREDEVVTRILAELDSEYDSLVTSITTRPDDVSLNELYARLLNHEMRLAYNNSSLQSNGSANLVLCNNNYQGCRLNSNNNRGHGRGRGRGGPPRNSSSNSQHSNERGPTCQVCGKVGHSTIRCFWKCYHQFDRSYQEEGRVAAAASYGVDTNWYAD